MATRSALVRSVRSIAGRLRRSEASFLGNFDDVAAAWHDIYFRALALRRVHGKPERLERSLVAALAFEEIDYRTRCVHDVRSGAEHGCNPMVH